MIKDLEFLFKKLFFSENFLLKRRLERAIKNNYEKELSIISNFKNKNNITFYATDDINKMVYKEVRKNDKPILKIYFREELIKIK